MDPYMPPLPDASVMDPQITGLAAVPPYQPPEPAPPPQSDVDEFLRKKRKAREHKACYPCRQRKVKCDLSRPCQTCRDRDHPELCSYHPPNKRQQVEPGPPTLKAEEGASTPTMVTLGRAEFDLLCSKLTGLENSIADLRREMSRKASPAPRSDHHTGSDVSSGGAPPPTHTEVHGIHTRNDAGEIVHFGGGSIPAMLYGLGQSAGQNEEQKHQFQEFLGKSVLPLFGLDNESATYPFVDLWGLPHGSFNRAQELAKALPNDVQMLQLWRFYSQISYAIYPGIPDPQQFEQDLNQFLINRKTTAGSVGAVTEQIMYGKNYYWLAVLYACLASGAQSSGLPRKERELTSQVYICCSFECLRFTNFLSQPHLESIQALCIIGNVMTNNMNAGTSWSLLGLTIRLAEGLGLHRNCPPHIPIDHVLPRSRVWWAIVWQDALLSLSYDRPSTITVIDIATMPPPQKLAPVMKYHATIYPLCKVCLDIVRDRAMRLSPRELHTRIRKQRDALAAVMRDAAEYLRDPSKCSDVLESVEYWGLRMHESYTLSELYRPAISPSKADVELIKTFRQPCIDSLTDTVEAYLEMTNITLSQQWKEKYGTLSFVRQTWASVHRALSSALLLSILGEHTRNERARKLVGRFFAVLVDIADSMELQDVAAPVRRGLNALRKLKIQEIRPPHFGNDATSSFADGSTLSDGSSSKLDHRQIVTPASSDDGDDHSPYSVLNSILWGRPDPAGDPDTYAVQ